MGDAGLYGGQLLCGGVPAVSGGLHAPPADLTARALIEASNIGKMTGLRLQAGRIPGFVFYIYFLNSGSFKPE